MRRLLRLPAFLSILMLILSAAGQETVSTEYRIGPQDLLQINVFGMDELNTQVRVSEDGNISLPFLGEVKVDGLTKAGMEQKLAELLKKYLQDPQVTIFIKEYISKSVSVLGAVHKPGVYQLVGRQTLFQMISQAGGPTTDAGNEIVVIRQSREGDGASLRIPIEDLMVAGDPRVNIPLEPNDVINVPADEKVVVYVFGQVKSPGALEVKKSSVPTLLKAIAKAGGFTERASKGDVRIKRLDADGKEIQIKVNVKDILRGKKKDVPLEPEDIIYVGETIF